MTTKTESMDELISDLSEQDRKAVEEQIKMLHGALRICENYIKGYPLAQTTGFKFIQAAAGLRDEIAETIEMLVAKHKLPQRYL